MVSIAEIFSNPLITFILGLIPSIITILIYYQAKVNSKEKALQPHLLKLCDTVSKIMTEEKALNLMADYGKMQHITDEWQEKQLLGEQTTANKEEYFEKYLVGFLNFSLSRMSAERLVEKCLDFESQFQSMDDEGLLSLLKKRHNLAFVEITDFQLCVQGILLITDRIRKENLKTTYEPQGNENGMNVQLSEGLEILFKIRSVAEMLFSRAPEVEKQLSKFL
jgi:hypothetical protein